MGVWGEGVEGKRQGRREGDGERIRQVDRARETGQRTGWTAAKAPSSTLRPLSPAPSVLQLYPKLHVPEKFLPLNKQVCSLEEEQVSGPDSEKPMNLLLAWEGGKQGMQEF